MTTPEADRSTDYFIGWGSTPRMDRRFLLGASLALLAGGGGLGWSLSRSHGSAGAGRWDQSHVRTFSGALLLEPFPALYTPDIDGVARTVFLVGNGKDGVGARLSSIAPGSLRVTGSLIRNGDKAMIAVSDDTDALLPLTASGAEPDHAQDLGPFRQIGEILDAKCWFGAMRPGAGKIHKSCAALCVRGGLPTAFCSLDSACGNAADAPLFVTEDGRAHGPSLLPLVGDPVLAEGRLVRVRDVVQARVALAGLTRI